MPVKRTNGVFLAVVLGVFVLFQTVLLYHVQVADYDEAIFLDIARNLQRSGLPLRSIGPAGVLYFIHTPLYLYLVTASVLIFGENLVLLRLVTTAFGAGALLLTYATVRRTQPSAAALVAALLVALNAFFALYAYFLTMEVPMVFFIVLAVYWLAQEEERGGRGYLILAGGAGATAVMLKELAVIFMAAAALYAFSTGGGWRDRLTRPFWLLLPLGGAVLLWIAWGLRLDAVGFQRGVLGWIGSAAGTGGIVDARSQTVLLNWLHTLGADVWGWATAVLLALSLPAYFLFFRRPLPKIVRLLFLYIALALAVSLLVRLKEPRHMLATIPMMAMVIGYLVEWDKVWNWVRGRRAVTAVAALLALFTVWNLSPLKLPPVSEWRNPEAWWQPMFSNRLYRSQYYYGLVRETGDYLRQITPEDAIITVIHEGPVTGYYADRRHYFLYNMPLPRTLETLAMTEYLVIDNFIFPNQTEEEKEVVRNYIADHFQLTQLLQDSHRQISVYQRIPPAPP
jgi:4-amino-4-deoxy-L-arabinose transferase-like glycosyltransferase